MSEYNKLKENAYASIKQSLIKYTLLKPSDFSNEELVLIAKYYLSDYAETNRISISIAQLNISIQGETTPFDNYLKNRKMLNKERVLNEIYKIQLILNVCYLEARIKELKKLSILIILK